jgi:hypothetical protein
VSDSRDRLVDDDVRVFLRTCIDDFEQLELLRLLVEHRGRTLAREEIASLVSIRPFEIQDVLDALLARGLISLGPGPRDVAYRVEDRELDHRVSKVLRAWREDQLGIIRFMNETARTRADSLTLKLFADAFILRGK